MKAYEIELNIDDVLFKSSKSLSRKIRYSINLLQKSERLALRLDSKDGFYLAMSGGKDSQVLYHIAKLSGVKFKAHMNLTSVDPPEVIRFVKTQYPDVELIKPKMSIYEMVKKETHTADTEIPLVLCGVQGNVRGGKSDAYRYS